EVATRATAAEPTGDGAAPAGEEQAGAEPDESCPLAGGERQCQGNDPDDERDRQPLRLHPRLSFAMNLWPYPTTGCGESRLIWKNPAAPGTPHELSDFWESADEVHFSGIPFESGPSRGYR